MNTTQSLFTAKRDLALVPGWGPTLCRRARATFGPDLSDILKENAYRLMEIEAVGFLKADAAALHFGMHPRDPRRISAAVNHILQRAETEGHTAMPAAVLIQELTDCLGRTIAGFDTGDAIIINDGLFSRRKTYEQECQAATILNRLLNRPPVARDVDAEGLAADQTAALRVAQSQNVFCLLGSPGTGKTYTLRKFLDSNRTSKIALAAPTGKAAKRIQELTGREATTIHRLLEAKFDKLQKRFSFARNASNPLNADIVVVDEASMLDIRLFADLLVALRPEARLLLVGDPYQLPSVGPGRVLADIVRSGAVPYCELTELKRQDPDLLIARNCARIRNGDVPVVVNGSATDFYVVEASGEDSIAQTAVELATKRLPAKYGLDPNRDIVTLTALAEKGPLSQRELNQRIRAVLNPTAAAEFAPGDRVMQTANNYQLDYGNGIFNGETGTVVGYAGHNLVVEFDSPSRTVREDRSNDLYFSLLHAWAVTTHRAQGSEWPWVIVVLDPSGRAAYVADRNHFYTAISRARTGCVVVGDMAIMRAIVGRVREQKRVTRLEKWLKS